MRIVMVVADGTVHFCNGVGLRPAGIEAVGTGTVGKSDDEEVITMDYLNELEREMLDAADQLEFERAAVLRDRIEELRKNLGKKMGIINFDKVTPKGRKRKKQQPNAETAPQPCKTKPRTRSGRDNRGLPKPER